MTGTAVIDLTSETSDSPPLDEAWSVPRNTPVHARSSAPALKAHVQAQAYTRRNHEPPSKRRRVEDTRTAQLSPRRHHQPQRDIKACLQTHVMPSLAEEVRKLPKDRVDINKLAEDAIVALAKTRVFKECFRETRGFMSKNDEVLLAKQIKHLVQEYLKDERYRLPTLPTPATSKPTESEDVPNETLSTITAVVEQAPLTRFQTPFPSASPVPKRRDPADRPFKPLERRSRRRRPSEDTGETKNLWFQLQQRPYCIAREREHIRRGLQRVRRPDGVTLPHQPTVYHVDFTRDEVTLMVTQLNQRLGTNLPLTVESLRTFIRQDIHVPTLLGNGFPKRSPEDLRNFCTDVLAGRAATGDKLQVLSLAENIEPEHPQDKSGARISSLLLARELEGDAGFGRMRRYENFRNEFAKAREDGLDMIAEFTNCAGDIATISWVSDENLICGTTAHSDNHNQQYNKPGNLLFCSTTEGTLRALPDHRIPRPLVDKGENSTEAMRRSQDPWLYSSVVSSDYDPVHNRVYTSSFDKTVKVWQVDGQGGITLLATWHHEGNVNFVAAAKDGSGRVASAADVPAQAVRIYTVNPDNVAESTHESFSCSRNDAGEGWAYYPATMQWGKAPDAQHLLAVGYSPRSVVGDDSDIPEDKRNTGEITLWHADAHHRIPLTTATTANVFEITWHPKLPRFVCATSPSITAKSGTRTQIHLFRPDPDRIDEAYCEYQSLDCKASDVNELTFQPNSLWHAYVTAACTDGNVYVWDTAKSDDPIHTLRHGVSLDGFEEDHVEKLDTGVKFTAWGISPDRFYTGSSDGVVRVWNVRNRRRPYVRTILEAPAPISSGAWSPDQTKLAIGDATGRVFLFSLDKRDEPQNHYRTLPIPGRPTCRVRRPMPFIPHPEPPPPEFAPAEPLDSDAMDVTVPDSLDELADDDIIEYSRKTYFETGQLVPTGNPTVGIVQGPNYASSGLFHREAHEAMNPSLPLLAQYERQQMESLHMDRGARRRSHRRLKEPMTTTFRDTCTHEFNVDRDFHTEYLSDEDMEELLRAGALLDLDGEEGWDFAYETGDDEVSDEELTDQEEGGW